MSSDVINVKDAPYSAAGNGTTDDTSAIQDAIDACFGTAGSPNGYNDRFDNLPLYFPAGRYKITSPLVFTDVCGGHIFGDGRESSQIQYATIANGETGFQINGMSNCLIENLTIVAGSTIQAHNNIAIDLDWDGTSANGTVGLSRNHFSNLALAGTIGIRIANTGNEGHSNLFQQSSWYSCYIGMHIVGADAYGQSCLYASGGENFRSIIVDGGQLAVFVGGTQSTSGLGGYIDVAYEFEFNNASTCVISGLRSETAKILLVNAAAQITVQGYHQAPVATTTGMVFANINHADAVVIIDGGLIYPVIGTAGHFYSRGTFWYKENTSGYGAPNFGMFPDVTGFSGTVEQMV